MISIQSRVANAVRSPRQDGEDAFGKIRLPELYRRHVDRHGSYVPCLSRYCARRPQNLLAKAADQSAFLGQGTKVSGEMGPNADVPPRKGLDA